MCVRILSATIEASTPYTNIINQTRIALALVFEEGHPISRPSADDATLRRQKGSATR